MRRAGVLALVVALAAAARLLPPGPAARQLGPGMALGVLLLGGYLAGSLVARVKLPQLTGYLLFGLAAGPAVGRLLEGPLLDALRPVDGMAVALIAMSAGAELRFSWLRRHAGRVAVVGGLIGLGVTALVTGALLLARAHVPFLADLRGEAAVLVALLVGITMASTSPLVILAVTAETRARGPVTDLLLGVAVLMDLVVVVAVGVVLALARGRLGGEAVSAVQVAWGLVIHLGGSLALGAALGGALVLWLRRVGRELALVVAGVCLAISEVGTRMHLEPLLVAIAAGMVLINFGGVRSGHFVRAIERVSLPVYALFFGLVGAHLDLEAPGLPGRPRRRAGGAPGPGALRGHLGRGAPHRHRGPGAPGGVARLREPGRGDPRHRGHRGPHLPRVGRRGGGAGHRRGRGEHPGGPGAPPPGAGPRRGGPRGTRGAGGALTGPERVLTARVPAADGGFSEPAMDAPLPRHRHLSRALGRVACLGAATVAVLALVAGGCGGGGTITTGNGQDGGGLVDDGGATGFDAGGFGGDAGTVDAGVADAGGTPDAGTPDAGTVDAGTPDAGGGGDGGVVDGGFGAPTTATRAGASGPSWCWSTPSAWPPPPGATST